MKRARSLLLFSSVVSSSIAIGISFAKPAGASTAPAPATAAPAATRPAAINVRIDNFAFQPRVLVIAAGATVTWKNADDVPHTATSTKNPQVFDSGALDTDDKFSFTFSKPGKYTYYCKVHPHMTGVVIVK
jgi:plastocyanin